MIDRALTHFGAKGKPRMSMMPLMICDVVDRREVSDYTYKLSFHVEGQAMPSLTREQELALNRFRSDALKAESEKIIDLVTRDAFIGRVKAVINAPKDAQLNLASQTLTPTALKAVGLPIQDDTRISSRYFEEGSNKATALGTRAVVEPLVSLPKDLSEPKLSGLRQKIGPNGNISLEGAATTSVCVCVGGGACVGIGGG